MICSARRLTDIFVGDRISKFLENMVMLAVKWVKRQELRQLEHIRIS
jgi:hypothetical protein